MKPAIDIETLTKDERSMMLYAESCCVDYSGLLEACRMNNEDMAALRRFQEAGLLTFGRVPAKLLGQLASYGRKPTHWVTLSESGWNFAWTLRLRRSKQVSPSRKAVDEVLAERAAA
ncbi:hypothetical protein [Burkholderia glumae]|uniref:hypothetical protein n=2 Tax=Burkholderia glumae TaxID=337 RepID=UPI000F5FFFE7|nr:hypothetical protein [Burkholderia glumae]MCM2546162.1 hypothetical protein [Burkholderia glumae]MCQ0032542.1 hypothetical protein [Burkholderia glumae]MCQ0035820.1 hypothetical protein [Burkholderia glumae]RQZ76426.1 hypothetical protein DF052_00275 [Burkholderia glumae]